MDISNPSQYDFYLIIRFKCLSLFIVIYVFVKCEMLLKFLYILHLTLVSTWSSQFRHLQKSAYKLIQSFHGLMPLFIHTNPKSYWNNCILTFETQFLLPLASKPYNIIIICFTRQSVFTHTCKLQPTANTSDGGVQRDWKHVCLTIHMVNWCFHIYP